MNYDEFKNYVDKKGYSDRSKLLFRVLDIEVKEEGGGARLFVFYHFWKSGDKGKVARISSARVDDVEELWEESITSDKWRVIYESSPPVRFGGSNHRPMWSNHTGGRISLRGERSIVASFGDYHMNGVHHERGPVSQDDTSSYGKILEIDIESGKKSIIAKGVRNPQGIYVDDAGKIWETEHGPYGGDELNLIEEGNNYGWPYFTYGRSEGIEWPHQVGAHTEYTRPLYVFEPRTGISNLIRVSGEPSRWDGDFLVSSLAGLKLFRIRIREDRVIHVEPIKVGERVRDLVQTDEGAFVLFADNGRFLELWSADSERPSADIGGEAKD
jgi:hypothetical protein